MSKRRILQENARIVLEFLNYFHGTLKREYARPHEFVMLQDAEVGGMVRAFTGYNGDRMHPSLIYVTPDEFVRKTGGGDK